MVFHIKCYIKLGTTLVRQDNVADSFSIYSSDPLSEESDQECRRHESRNVMSSPLLALVQITRI